MMPETIYGYLKAEEAKFQTDEIQVGENWFWNLRRHVQLIFHFVHNVFYTGENNWLRAFKSVMRPVRDLANWTEDIEVKDVLLFIEGANGRALSFLAKKYHDEVYTREHDLDKLFDDITDSDNTYGGVVVQKGKDMPEVLPLMGIAFCDQTNLLGSPISFKHYFSPSALRNMASAGWGEKANGATISIDQLIKVATFEKDAAGTPAEKQNRVPGKQIEVYITKGSLPESYLREDGDPETFVPQARVDAFYTDKDKKRVGVTLYRKEDAGKSLKFYASEEVYGRALGFGIGESLLHPQIWTNFLTVHKTQMLEAAAKVPLVTDDETFSNKNKINEMENLEITTIAEGKEIRQVPTAAPANIQLYQQAIDEWYEQAQLSGSAFDPLLGKEASSGTTFKGQERTVAQGRGLHDRRRGQRAKFIEQIYRDWILPDIMRAITKDTEFLATLSLEEMTWVVDQLTTNHVNRRIIDGMLQGKLMTKEERDLAAQLFRESFIKNGSKQLLKIAKDDFKDAELRIGINVAGKQKDLVNLSDKLLSVFQFVFANPAGFQQAMQIPALSKSFADILEFSGINQADFASLLAPPPQPVALPAPEAQGQPQAPQLALSQPQPAQS